MRSFILDSDIGDDIDDAYALDLALSNNLNIIGITTVFNNTINRAKIAKKMCLLNGKDIPCYFGYSIGLNGEMRANIFSQYSPDLENPLYNPNNTKESEAIDFIIKSALKYKSELYILAIGPLTNIAKAIITNKSAMQNIGGIILMGGDYKTHYAEWNIICDIEAAKIVLESDINITAFGHEWTSRLKLTDLEQSFVLSEKNDNYLNYLKDLNIMWLRDKKEGWKVVLHDLTVVRYAIDDSYCKIKRIPVYVETLGYASKGMTLNLDKIERVEKKHYINICEELDVDEFKKYFLDNLKRRCQ